MVNYKISVLIPSWNGGQYITDCLNSILENNYDHFQIISIAGGNDKAYKISLKIQKDNPEKLIALSRKEGKKNEALNLGLDKADGDILVITDVDCIYPINWLSKINEIFQDKSINVITGGSLPYNHLTNALAEYNRIRAGYNLIKFQNGGFIIGNKLWGGNSAFRAEVFFSKIGKFEVESVTGDDKILGMEFNKRGEDLYFFRDIYVYTEHYSSNLKKLIDRRVRWAKDLFIDFKRKDYPKLLFLLGIGLFKFFYPPLVIIIWFLFLIPSLNWLLLLLSPWITFFILYIIGGCFELMLKSKKVNKELNTKFSYWKALKIVPLMFFIFGIVSIRSFLNPKRRQWYH